MAFLKDIKRNPAYKKQLNGLLPDKEADTLDVVDFDVQPSEEEPEGQDPETRPVPPLIESGNAEQEPLDPRVKKKRKQVSAILNGLKGTE